MYRYVPLPRKQHVLPWSIVGWFVSKFNVQVVDKFSSNVWPGWGKRGLETRCICCELSPDLSLYPDSGFFHECLLVTYSTSRFYSLYSHSLGGATICLGRHWTTLQLSMWLNCRRCLECLVHSLQGRLVCRTSTTRCSCLTWLRHVSEREAVGQLSLAGWQLSLTSVTGWVTAFTGWFGWATAFTGWVTAFINKCHLLGDSFHWLGDNFH